MDPPYDCRFNHYGVGTFESSDQRRLFELVARLPCMTLLVTQETPLTAGLADALTRSRDDFVVESYKARYAFCAKGRHSRQAQHLLIRNYDV